MLRVAVLICHLKVCSTGEVYCAISEIISLAQNQAAHSAKIMGATCIANHAHNRIVTDDCEAASMTYTLANPTAV